MTDLIFTYNWNNKLQNKAFTTIRLRNDKKYEIGKEFSIQLQPKGKPSETLGIAKIIDVKHFTLEKLNNFIAHIDTGYSKEECEKIILRMYPKVDFKKTELSLILLSFNKIPK